MKTVIEEYDDYHKLFNNVNYVNFMNHGYFPASKILNKEDTLFKFEATLYLQLLKYIKVKNLKLLDIGCGRGGGLNIFKKYFNFKNLYGCDINESAIDYCKKNFKGIDFKISNAEKLNYNKNYFDVITNVESFHCYENGNSFLKECFRVLKNKGSLLIADINVHLNFKDFGDFKLKYSKDITPNVAFACKHNVINFSKNIENKEIRNFLINTMQEKLFSYLKNNSYFILHLVK